MAPAPGREAADRSSDKWIGLLPAMLLAFVVRIPQFLDRLLSGCNGERACELLATGPQVALMGLLLLLCILCGVGVSLAYLWRRRRRAGEPLPALRIGLAWAAALLVAIVAIWIRYGPYAALAAAGAAPP